jgi:hypothetical protein
MNNEISYRVMKTHEFKDSIFYRVACDCTDKNHDATIEFEYDKECNMISMHFYKEIIWESRWGEERWYMKLWKRLSCSIRMLFTGHIELEDEFLFLDIEHMSEFITALIEGRQKIQSKMESCKLKRKNPTK